MDNLIKWRYEGIITKREQDRFGKKMIDSGDKHATISYMFAPDIVEIEGKYYLYYGIGLSKSGLALAVLDSPVGPFEYVGRIRYPEEEKPNGWVDNTDGIR